MLKLIPGWDGGGGGGSIQPEQEAAPKEPIETTWGIEETTKKKKKQKEDIIDLLKRVPDVDIYGLLLTTDSKHPLSHVVRERWYELHNLTGPNFLLVAFEPPDEWHEAFKNYWRGQLGDSFEQIWEKWGKKPEPGVAYKYGTLFEPPLKSRQFPCLVLFTSLRNLKKQRIAVRSFPKWDSESLFILLSGMFDSIQDCCKKPKKDRLECLQSSLTSPTTKFSDNFKYREKQAVEYMKKHPATIVGTAATFALALTNANLLPIGAAAVSILGVLKDRLK